ncbi:hypothetical protein ACFL49_00135 [Candidatus Omnitrophota bacterium]
MNIPFQRSKTNLIYRIFSAFLCFTFMSTCVLPPQSVQAQILPTLLNLPVPGTVVPLSAGYMPAMITGVTIHPDNPLRFDFIVDKGETGIEGQDLRVEGKRLVKYFLAALTVPENEMWVNLSPYEKDRIIPESFGDTEMGQDLLAQDYMLK